MKLSRVFFGLWLCLWFALLWQCVQLHTTFRGLALGIVTGVVVGRGLRLLQAHGDAIHVNVKETADEFDQEQA